MHHTGSREELPVAAPKEQAGIDQQEVQTQEMQEAEEQVKELPECVDHRPSSFKRGKPQSIISLLFYKNNLNTYVSI
jgi:hypothetical protein